MRVGSLVYATEQGLGILARSFVEHGIVTDPYVVIHPSHETHLEWYKGARSTRIRPVSRDVNEWATSLDLLLCFETPFDWMLFPWCRRHNVKTALVTMYECTPETMPTEPDMFFCPSTLDARYFNHKKSMHLPIPVDVQWRQRKRALKYVHHAGHGSFRDRNGTHRLIESLRFVKKPIDLLIRSQREDEQLGQMITDNVGKNTAFRGNVSLKIGTVPYENLWTNADVFVFPETFNGLSLPLQEARAAGLLVIATDRFPMNEWLPTEPLVTPQTYNRAKIGGPYNSFEEAVIDPAALAAKLDEWYDRDISDYSLDGAKWASENSWQALAPVWTRAIDFLIKS
jgi:glycosyltransferase involved in cell wall biosynthesis